MSTAAGSIPPSRPHFRRWIGLAIRGVTLVLGVLVLGMGAGVVGSRPQIQGEASAAGLEQPALIIRDEHGVPHIFAANDHDVYFALGYAHAQDRFFQMDLTRRSIHGTLSELAGGLTLRLDARARVKGLNRIAEAQTERLTPRVRAALQAYADGVNARLKRAPPSPEYIILFARAERWRVEDSVAVGLALTDTLVSGEQFDFAAATLGKTLSPAQYQDFFPRFPAWAADSIGARGESGGTQSADGISPGSNAWAVSGKLTKSGEPILAGDPHLGLSAPGPFYLAHLKLTDRDLVGFTVPGAPFLAFGRNDDVAWAITNNEIDSVDIARVDDTAARDALTRTEVVRVRQLFGAREVRVQVRETAEGPLLDRRWFALDPYGQGEFRWRDITLDADNDLINALAAMNEARTLDDIIAAQRGWRAPLVHIVAASRGGIALIAAGDPALRDETGVWTGRASPAARLIIRDPPSARLAAANNIASSSDFTAGPNGAFDPFRVTRIHELLEDGASADLGGATRMQNDKQSLLARRLLPVLREARPKTARGAEALALLKRWNGAMDADRPEPLIFAAWLDRLSRAIYADEVGAQAYARYAVPRPIFLDAILTRGGEAWCDNVKTVRRETCAELTGPALDDAMDDLVRNHGANTGKWRWGDVHVARFAHPLFTGLPLVGGVFDVVAPVGGAADTLAVAAYLGDRDFTAVHGPGARAVYDFADLDRSRFMVAPGQSGHVLSPHYRDLVSSWAAGESFEVRSDWAPETRPKGAAVLTLTPR